MRGRGRTGGERSRADGGGSSEREGQFPQHWEYLLVRFANFGSPRVFQVRTSCVMSAQSAVRFMHKTSALNRRGRADLLVVSRAERADPPPFSARSLSASEAVAGLSAAWTDAISRRNFREVFAHPDKDDLMALERTFSIIKPDATARNLT